MGEAYIVAASRTAGGRRNGRLKDWHAADLAGKVLKLVDAIEGAHAVLLDAYAVLPASQRAWIAAALDVADTHFVIEILIALLLGAAAFDFARGSRSDAAAAGVRRKDE